MIYFLKKERKPTFEVGRIIDKTIHCNMVSVLQCTDCSLLYCIPSISVLAAKSQFNQLYYVQ